ncbi:hypothetical protein E2C01_047897 [Portunus trituberculatus]|uniref:Uncharacterized protein n=1 Tax=Portunus trituberculatus TaxID=210409 RepID=A0A5B7G9R4_PORTR|nr:hypothetical protein [Portunus trituberculatus]
MVLDVKLKVSCHHIIKRGPHGCPGCIEEWLPNPICSKVELVESVTEHMKLFSSSKLNSSVCTSQSTSLMLII